MNLFHSLTLPFVFSLLDGTAESGTGVWPNTCENIRGQNDWHGDTHARSVQNHWNINTTCTFKTFSYDRITEWFIEKNQIIPNATVSEMVPGDCKVVMAPGMAGFSICGEIGTAEILQNWIEREAMQLKRADGLFPLANKSSYSETKLWISDRPEIRREMRRNVLTQRVVVQSLIPCKNSWR